MTKHSKVPHSHPGLQQELKNDPREMEENYWREMIGSRPRLRELNKVEKTDKNRQTDRQKMNIPPHAWEQLENTLNSNSFLNIYRNQQNTRYRQLIKAVTTKTSNEKRRKQHISNKVLSISKAQYLLANYSDQELLEVRTEWGQVFSCKNNLERK